MSPLLEHWKSICAECDEWSMPADLERTLGEHGLAIVPAAQKEMLIAVRKVLNDWATGKFSDRHYEAHKAMRKIQDLNDTRELAMYAQADSCPRCGARPIDDGHRPGCNG